MSNYENLPRTIKTLYEKQLCLCETLLCIDKTAGDLGNMMSRVNETCNLKTSHNCLKGTTDFSLQSDSNGYNANITSQLLSSFRIQTKHLTSNQLYALDRSRSRCIKHIIRTERRDREPSRIPVRKLVYLMSKLNKTKRCKIKSLIRKALHS